MAFGRRMDEAVDTRTGTPSDEITDTRGFVSPAPRKTIVGATGRTPIKTVATTPRYDSTPIKTVVGSTARAPIKSVVGARSPQPPPKVVAGPMGRPPLKTTRANLGTGGKNPLGMAAADRGPINSANPSTQSTSIGRNDGNPGRSVSGMGPIVGPANPTLSWERPARISGVVAGGMGPTAKRMPGGAARPPRGSRRASAFFGE